MSDPHDGPSERPTWEPPAPSDGAFDDDEATVGFDGDPRAFLDADATLQANASDDAPSSFDDEEATTFDAGQLRATDAPAPTDRRTDRRTEPAPSSAEDEPHDFGGFAPHDAGSEPPRQAPSRAMSGVDLLGKATQSFGDYTLGPAVGSGGMAEVRLGYETMSSGQLRPCVIKRIARTFVRQKKFQEMFAEEIRLSRVLRHPNIVEAYEDGVLEGTPYIVFELVDGVTVADLKKLAGRPIPLTVAIDVADGVARALSYAHGLAGDHGQPLDLVHRDISPQNILISRRGEVKLVDFGIARFEGREHMTMAGEVKGKMRYMAPEQLAESQLNGQTDLFSLGIVIGELLDALQEGMTEHFCSGVKATSHNLPPRLHDLLLQMTTPDIAKRLGSADLLIDELRVLRERLEGPSLLAFAREHVFQKRAPLVPDEIAAQMDPRAAPSPVSQEIEPVEPEELDEPEDGDMGYADTIMRARKLMPRLSEAPAPVVHTVPATPPARGPSDVRPHPIHAQRRSPTPPDPRVASGVHPHPGQPRAHPAATGEHMNPLMQGVPYPGQPMHPAYGTGEHMNPMMQGVPPPGGAPPGMYPGGPMHPGYMGTGEHSNPLMQATGMYGQGQYPMPHPPPQNRLAAWALPMAVGSVALILVLLIFVLISR